jgi:hypothetical protein
MYHHWNGRYTADLLVMLNPFIRWGTAGYETRISADDSYLHYRQLSPDKALCAG